MLRDAAGSENQEIQNRPSVLVVDDQELLARALAQRLAMDGIEATIATDVAQGMDLCTTRRFNAAFIDLRLPDGDGGSVAMMAKQLNPSMFVVVMTGAASAVDDPVLSGVQADILLPKPWNPRELRPIIRAILSSAS